MPLRHLSLPSFRLPPLSSLSLPSMEDSLSWAYGAALTGVPQMGTAEQLARDYALAHPEASPRQQATALIRWQVAKTAASGFVGGLGGLATLPVSLPAGLAFSLYTQLRMVAAIAHLAGLDIRHDRVQTLIYLCLCGASASDLLKQNGVQLGQWLLQEVMKSLSLELLGSLNKTVGLHLAGRFSSGAAATTLQKATPLVGGLVGASLDGFATRAVGVFARDLFLPASPLPVPTPPEF